MDIIPVVLLAFGLAIGGSEPEMHASAMANCESLKLTKQKEILANGSSRIELRASGGKAPYYYFFFDGKGNPLSWDFDKNQLVVKETDKKAPVTGKVVDANGCIRIIELTETEGK